MAGLAAILDEEAPLEHDIFADIENPPIKHGADPVLEPRVEFSAAPCIGENLDAEANLSEGYGADVQSIKRLCGNEG